MIDITGLSHIFGKIYTVSTSISILLNACLLYLIVYNSPKYLGAYKHLMFMNAVFEMIYSMIDMLLAPIHLNHEHVVIVLSRADNSFLSRQVLLTLHAIYWGCFGASLAFFAVLFIYRYLVITGHPLISSFNSWKIVLWLLIPVFLATSLSFSGLMFCRPTPETTELFREKVLEVFGRSIDDFEYLALHLYDTDQDRIIRYRIGPMFSAMFLFISTFSSFIIIIFFGIRCYTRIAGLLETSTSQHHKDIQSELFWALLVQTVIPIFFMHTPEVTILLVTLFRIDIGVYCSILSVSIAIYPAIDPLPNFFIIKPYRDAILNSLGCKKNSAQP